jgi:hypothetical protein
VCGFLIFTGSVARVSATWQLVPLRLPPHTALANSERTFDVARAIGHSASESAPVFGRGRRLFLQSAEVVQVEPRHVVVGLYSKVWDLRMEFGDVLAPISQVFCVYLL